MPILRRKEINLRMKGLLMKIMKSKKIGYSYTQTTVDLNTIDLEPIEEAISSSVFAVWVADHPNVSKEETTAYIHRTIRRTLNLVRDNDYNYVFFKQVK
jgi:hypothetical protein